jgi:hypothetical protein
VVCRYNEEKTLSWLEAKARRLASGLAAKNMLGGRSSTFVQEVRGRKKATGDESKSFTLLNPSLFA